MPQEYAGYAKCSTHIPDRKGGGKKVNNLLGQAVCKGETTSKLNHHPLLLVLL
jgi:hypothetical protein